MSASATFWAWRQDVESSAQKVVLLCLADCHNQDTDLCIPSIPYIASKTRCNRKTVIKAIKELESAGLITAVRSGRSGNNYTLHLDVTVSDQVHHFVYRTEDPTTGEYYIGLHSTKNKSDGYKGSGTWVRKHQNESALVVKILMEFDTREQAVGAELAIISTCINDEKCMNRKDESCPKTGTKNNSAENGTRKNGTIPNKDNKDPNNGRKESQKQPPNLEEPKTNLKDIYRKLSLSDVPFELHSAVKEFIDHRVNLKKPLTQDALKRFLSAVSSTSTELSMSPESVIAETIDAGWQSVKPEWMRNRLGGRNATSTQHRQPDSEVGRVKAAIAKRAAEREAALSGGGQVGDPGGGSVGPHDGVVYTPVD